MNAPPPSSPDPFADRLLPGETVLWRGRPRQGVLFTPRDAMLVPFSLVWGGFALFWEARVLAAPAAPRAAALFGAVFALIGLFLIFGRFAFDAWIRARVVYALTDRRALIVRERPSASFQAVQLDRLAEASLHEAAGGRGTIRLGPADSLWNRRWAGGGVWIPSLDPAPQFLAIEDVRKVFGAIQERMQTERR